jgi:hypothetical protein
MGETHLRRFAEGTTVPVAKTRGEIEAMVSKHGATRFASGWMEDRKAAISFAMRGRLVRFTLTLPTEDEAKELRGRGGWSLSADQRAKWIDAEERRRWRCLLLALKAKLEVVESGIATFEEEFLAHVVTPDNLTVNEAIKLMEGEGRLMLPPVRAAGST